MERLDKIEWEKFRGNPKSTISKDEYKLVCELHAKYFNHKYKEPCTCNPKTIKQWIGQLNNLYEHN